MAIILRDFKITNDELLILKKSPIQHLCLKRLSINSKLGTLNSKQ